MNGSGKQVLVSAIQVLSTQLTPEKELRHATAKLRAGLFLHGSTADDHLKLVPRVAWISKHDDDGDIVIQGVGTKGSHVLLSEVLDVILTMPGLEQHVREHIPPLSAEDYDACQLVLSLIVSASQMFSELLPVETSGIDVDEWLSRCENSSLGALLYS